MKHIQDMAVFFLLSNKSHENTNNELILLKSIACVTKASLVILKLLKDTIEPQC